MRNVVYTEQADFYLYERDEGSVEIQICRDDADDVILELTEEEAIALMKKMARVMNYSGISVYL